MVKTENIFAIILAAGLSERMGQFKPLMDLGGQTIMERERSIIFFLVLGITKTNLFKNGRRIQGIRPRPLIHLPLLPAMEGG